MADVEARRKDVVAKRKYNNDGDGESEAETLFPLGVNGAWPARYSFAQVITERH